ncbi:unnamed protein product, partial [Prorocentrum cordatum]
EAGEFQGHAAVAPPGQAQPGAGPEVEAAARSEHQVAEFQQWWDAGHGAGAAAEHAVLGLIDVCQLAQIVSAGAGYHTILTLDRLDALQRRIASDGRAELDPLRRALQARGGAKPQARAVGSLLFREALALFLGLRQGRPGAAPGAALASSPRGPPMGQAGAAVAAGTPPRRGGDGAAAAGATSDAAGAAALDEAWEPPRPFVVCSEELGVRCAPCHQGELLASVPRGTELLATGRHGEFLSVQAFGARGEPRAAFVPLAAGGVQLLVEAPASPERRGTGGGSGARGSPPQGPPAPGPAEVLAADPTARLLALEAKVQAQDAELGALREELACLREGLGAAAALFKGMALSGDRGAAATPADALAQALLRQVPALPGPHAAPRGGG